jgi:hypothetical protein
MEGQGGGKAQGVADPKKYCILFRAYIIIGLNIQKRVDLGLLFVDRSSFTLLDMGSP